jgi:hypothetical protein
MVAYRLKNEFETNYLNWCGANSEISDYMVETEWTLSQGSGVKEICIQAMTYNGVTTEFCVPVIADYFSTVFEIKLYADDSYAELLPTYNGMHVAATLLNTTTGDANSNRIIYTEIIPSRQIEFTSDIHDITYDVLQQGDNDLFDQVATEQFTEGRQVFRGSFTVHKEDNVLNVDGLARIRVNFPDECQAETSVALGSFVRDSLNLTIDTQFGEVAAEENTLDPYRQDISGRIGVGMTIRPNEDPYFIFGDPSFYTKKEDPVQPGIPQPEESGS